MLGFLHIDNRRGPDGWLTRFALGLEADDWQLAGAVPHGPGASDCRGDIDLWVLGGVGVMRISQSLGPGAQGCRLDAGALEAVVQRVATTLPGAEALILNKFGKQEAMGRGFRPLIAEAMAAGIPVLIGVSPAYLAAFNEFAGDLARELDPDSAPGWLSRHARTGLAANQMHQS